MATDKRKRAIRALAAERDISYTAAMRLHDTPLSELPATSPQSDWLWDGEHASDPLTLNFGDSLTSDAPYPVVLRGDQAHALICGLSGSGKTSLLEMLMGQVLVKPMPWDNALRGSVHLIDFRNETAKRWRGRAGVTTSVAQLGDAPDEAVLAVDREVRRRQQILSARGGPSTWEDLPESVLRAEKFAPFLIAVDEGDDDSDGRNGIRDHVISWARQGRAVGLVVVLLRQRPVSTELTELLPLHVAMGRVTPVEETVHGFPASLGAPHESPAGAGWGRVRRPTGKGLDWVRGARVGQRNLDKWLPRVATP